jgi:SAM-dependent methyltransferase
MQRGRRGEFDRYAHSYDTILEETLRITGENKDYFARGRLECLARCLARLGKNAGLVLDFGCGTGSTIPLLFEFLGAERIIAIEEFGEMAELARARFGSERVSIRAGSDSLASAVCDTVFCSAVFHHIPSGDRAGVARQIFEYLKPGGLFAFWEHNGWSPAARYVMSQCEFDRGCIPLSAAEARKMLRAVGFEIVRTDFRFIFPRALRWFRGLEPRFTRIPLGAQFQVLCRKPL